MAQKPRWVRLRGRLPVALLAAALCLLAVVAATATVRVAVTPPRHACPPVSPPVSGPVSPPVSPPVCRPPVSPPVKPHPPKHAKPKHAAPKHAKAKHATHRTPPRRH